MTQGCLFAAPTPLFQCLWMGTIATKSGDRAVVCWEVLEQESHPTSDLGGVACQGQDMNKSHPIDNMASNVGEIRKPTETRTVLLSPSCFFPSFV